MKKTFCIITLLLAAVFAPLVYAQTTTNPNVNSHKLYPPATIVDTTTGSEKAFSSSMTGAANTGIAGYFSNTATATGYGLVVIGNSSIPVFTHALGAVTTYTIVGADMGLALSTSGASAIAVTLPQAGTTLFGAGVGFGYMNLGPGVATITPTTSKINGLSSLAFAQYQGGYFLSDGTNWFANTGIGSTTSGTVNSGSAGNFGYYAGAGTAVSPSTALNQSTSSYIGVGTTSPATPLDVENNANSSLLTLGSSNTSGSYIILNNTSAGAHEYGIAAGGSANHPGQLLFQDFSNSFNAYYSLSSTRAAFLSTLPIGWPASGDAAGSIDTGISRSGVANVALGNGTAGNTSGKLFGAAFVSAGTKFTASGCSNGTTVGGATAGKLTLGANTCSVVITMGNSSTATNGWSCWVNDETSTTLFIGESGSTTTTATFAIPVTAGTTDVIDFGCVGF